MTTTYVPTDVRTPHRARDCSTRGNVTRSLLGYLALAGPFYIVVSLAQALTRSGFSLARDDWSLLALGHLGWIQGTNLILTGAMTVLGAVGVRRAIGHRDAGHWAPRLLAGYGMALVGAGIFRADPANGFPSGAPHGAAGSMSWHAGLHVLFGVVGFACLIAACFVVARSQARRGQRRAGVVSRVVGIIFAVAFAGIATGSATAATTVPFIVAVVGSYVWLTALAISLYRGTRFDTMQPASSSR